MIIKRLGHCGPAQRAQHAELQRHLARQLADRRTYWICRAQSRLDSVSPCPQQLRFILDSMDMAKYAWPKSRVMASKEFNSWPRPRMSCTTMIAHGHLVLSVLTPHCIPANSSRSTEIMSLGMTKISRERNVDFRRIRLNIQADNCSKEVKNACSLRHFAYQVAKKRLHSCQLSFLQSGHSHEDVDSLFSNLRAWLSQHPELHTPDCFRSCLTEYFANPRHRDHEKLRSVVMMDKYRDWNFASNNVLIVFNIMVQQI